MLLWVVHPLLFLLPDQRWEVLALQSFRHSRLLALYGTLYQFLLGHQDLLLKRSEVPQNRLQVLLIFFLFQFLRPRLKSFYTPRVICHFLNHYSPHIFKIKCTRLFFCTHHLCEVVEVDLKWLIWLALFWQYVRAQSIILIIALRCLLLFLISEIIWNLSTILPKHLKQSLLQLLALIQLSLI